MALLNHPPGPEMAADSTAISGTGGYNELEPPKIGPQTSYAAIYDTLNQRVQVLSDVNERLYSMIVEVWGPDLAGAPEEYQYGSPRTEEVKVSPALGCLDSLDILANEENATHQLVRKLEALLK